MTINVRSTKQDGSQERQATARYQFEDSQENSKKPVAIMLLLTGLALYLKSAFPGWGRSDAFSQPDLAPDDAKMAPKVVNLPADNVLGFEVEPQSADTSADGKKPLSSGGPAFELLDSPTFIYVPSPEIEARNFGDIEVVPPKSYQAPSFGSANDNIGPPAVSGQGADGDLAEEPEDDDDPGEDDGDDDDDPDRGIDDDDIDVDEGPDDDDDDDDDDDEEEESQNRAPNVSGPVYLHDVFGCMAAIIGLSSLLQNASDPDGDTLAISNLTVSSGTITQAAQGWAFEAALLGPVTITYQITDGEFWVTQYAYFNVVENPPIIGTDGNDVLIGTECADDIDGGPCDDNIDGRGGNDTLNGGDGNDHIVAGAGNDTVFGGSGHDVIFGLAGNDWLSGGKGDDRLFGGDGDDIVFGDEGNDLLHGDAGEDILFGGKGDDIAHGGDGRDIIHGGDGDDVLVGNAGNDIAFGDAGNDHISGNENDDVLSGGDGQDTVLGGAGNDTVIGDTDRVEDTYDGGGGIDTLDYSAAFSSIEVDLSQSSAKGLEIGDDTVIDFEILKTGAGGDTIVGTDATEEIHANAGNDVIDAGGGNDIIADGEGCDVVLAGSGDDVVIAAADGDDDQYDGGDGIDTLDYSASVAAVTADLGAGTVQSAETGDDTNSEFEMLVTGSGHDAIIDGGAYSSVAAGSGNDTIIAAADGDDDQYDGGDGIDTVDYSVSQAAVLIDFADKTATGVDIGTDQISSFEMIVGGQGDDYFIVNDQPVSLQGGAGNDVFQFEALAAGTQVVHDILDFMVGDRIKISKYEIFKEVMDSLEDRFEDIYGDAIDEDELPIRIRHEQTDQVRQTLIDVDFDRDETYEMTINIAGDHLLMVIDHA